MSARRKYSVISGTDNSQSAFLSRRDKNPIARYASTISSNSINVVKDCVRHEFVVNQDDSLQRTSNTGCEIDYCEFPYYRSNRTDGSQDAVLVKDVGVSCKLLNEKPFNSDISISGIESYLIRQLRLEYNELSSITRKLNAYTKDILSNLAAKCRRKDQVLRKLHVNSKHGMTSQCTDKIGDPCLKLKFCNVTERKCKLSEIYLNNNFAEKDIVRQKTHGNRNMRKRHMKLDKAFVKGFLELSPKCSGVLLRNYLIRKREKVSGNVSVCASKTSLRKTEHFAPSGRTCKNRGADKSRECFYASKCNPLVLTNWREVSGRKNCGFKSEFTAGTFSESGCTINRA